MSHVVGVGGRGGRRGVGNCSGGVSNGGGGGGVRGGIVDTDDLARRIKLGERRAIAKGITLVESTLPAHRQASIRLLTILSADGTPNSKSVRVGISGPPGVGKSTFIEAFGTYLTSLGLKVAVLAVDPSSVRRGGSILGDKTRMIELSRNPRAYVRPSPSRGTLGGVTRSTSEAICVCEASGHDVTLIETVGVGQSEIAVEDMVDVFVLLVNPAGGDELQGIKKGIIELADIIVVNKSDGSLKAKASLTAVQHTSALSLLERKFDGWAPKVLSCSAKENKGIAAVWSTIEEHGKVLSESGELGRRRGRQRESWLWKMVEEGLKARLLSHKGVQDMLPKIIDDVNHMRTLPAIAASNILDMFGTQSSSTSVGVSAESSSSPSSSSSSSSSKLA